MNSIKANLNQNFGQCSLTIAVFQLDEQCVFIHEVIEVCYDVVVLQDGEDAYFVHDISALPFREGVQVHLLPYH